VKNFLFFRITLHVIRFTIFSLHVRKETVHTLASPEKRLAQVIDDHRLLYADPTVETKLRQLIDVSPHSFLTESELIELFRRTQSIFFNTHLEVASGHHTGTYLRFESIAHFPNRIDIIVQDMANWVSELDKDQKVHGIMVPNSDARLLAEGIANRLKNQVPLRVVAAPFDPTTGRIGTDVPPENIQKGEHFIAFNDVTARGNCVNKLGQIVTDRGGTVVGMMVFARRDSGQFPFMDELTAQYPFYYSVGLDMPQWEQSECSLCRLGEELLSWRDMPLLRRDA